MTKQVMKRTSSDNVYLHKDFHGALSAAIEYLHRNHGADAVRDYLRQFTKTYYSPLIADVNRRGLVALKEHFESIYAVEGAPVRLTCSKDELIVDVEWCPAVTHMRKHGYPVAELFSETTRTVNEALCENTPFSAELVSYDPQTGRSVQRFVRRQP
ncbi:MAG: hypothetical protein A2Z18_05340 [Armatimonadetes bacterium RBG_16_58_9]|nr:MAG: hypothetical protein A2Z18_05340 [Armatimonadetes bacterium RBG_16_58_9]